MARYARNGILTPEQQAALKAKQVLIVGAGGLGGYILEGIVRVGVGNITLIDSDCFETSNLNRQLLATHETLGKSKALVGRERALAIDETVQIVAAQTALTEENACEWVKGKDLVFDALDNITSRRALHAACQKLGVPLVHGAIAGWMGQVAFIAPGDTLFDKLYPTADDKGYELHIGNPAFTPAIVAGYQVAEGVKYLSGQGELLRHCVLTLDLQHNHMTIIRIE